MSEVARDAPAGLAAFASDLYHCADCGYCVDAVWAERGINHVCPTISHHQPIASYSGRGYIAAARAWYEGADIDEDALAARVFACTGCGNCEQVCPIGLRPAQIGQLLRETLVTRGHAPASVEQLRVTMRAHGNPQAMPAAARGGWAEGLEFVDAGATVLYAPGCAAAFNAPAEAAAAVALLALAGEQVAWRGDADRCCGAPLREAGLTDDAAYAEHRLAADITPPTVVTSGLECWPAWRGALAATTRVLSFPAWLLEALDRGRLKIRVSPALRVRVFDGCASRRPGVHGSTPDPLREVLTRCGASCVNDALGAATAVCCGAAGAMAELAPASATRMAQARLREASANAIIVTSDPRCGAHLAASTPTVTVLGLAEFLLAHGTLEAGA